MSCDGTVDFPLEEKKRLVDRLVCDVVNFLFKVNKLKTKYTGFKYTSSRWNMFSYYTAFFTVWQQSGQPSFTDFTDCQLVLIFTGSANVCYGILSLHMMSTLLINEFTFYIQL